MGSLARPAWAWLLLVACHGAPAPAMTRPPPPPPPVVVVAPPPPAPVREPPAPTWDEVRGELPELHAYAPIARVDPPAWLAEVDVVWIRVGAACRPITLNSDDHGRGALEVCTAKLPDADVSCTRTMEVSLALRTNGLLQCSASFPNGAGMGVTRGDDTVLSSGSLVAADDQRLRYAPTWRLSVEAERLVWMQGECTPASVTRLTRALAAEGLGDDALREALFDRHGVLGHGRRCREHHGVRLHARRSDARDVGDRGAEPRDATELQDCTIACPDTAGPLRRLNGVLSAQVFVRTADTTSTVVHRTRAACDADPTANLPTIPSRPCRDWLSNTAKARSKPQ